MNIILIIEFHNYLKIIINDSNNRKENRLFLFPKIKIINFTNFQNTIILH